MKLVQMLEVFLAFGILLWQSLELVLVLLVLVLLLPALGLWFFHNRCFLLDRLSRACCFWGIPFFSFFPCHFGPTFISFWLVLTRVLFLYFFDGSCFFSGSCCSDCGSSWLVFFRAECGYMTELLTATSTWSSALHLYHHSSVPANNSFRDGLKVPPRYTQPEYIISIGCPGGGPEQSYFLNMIIGAEKRGMYLSSNERRNVKDGYSYLSGVHVFWLPPEEFGSNVTGFSFCSLFLCW